jgi:hypothetical protein
MIRRVSHWGEEAGGTRTPRIPGVQSHFWFFWAQAQCGKVRNTQSVCGGHQHNGDRTKCILPNDLIGTEREGSRRFRATRGAKTSSSIKVIFDGDLSAFRTINPCGAISSADICRIPDR